MMIGSKSSLKEGKGGKRRGAKLHTKKKVGVQNRTIGKKIGGKSSIKTHEGPSNQKGGKRLGAKTLKKRRGYKIAQLAKDRGESAIKPIIYIVRPLRNRFIEKGLNMFFIPINIHSFI